MASLRSVDSFFCVVFPFSIFRAAYESVQLVIGAVGALSSASSAAFRAHSSALVPEQSSCEALDGKVMVVPPPPRVTPSSAEPWTRSRPRATGGREDRLGRLSPQPLRRVTAAARTDLGSDISRSGGDPRWWLVDSRSSTRTSVAPAAAPRLLQSTADFRRAGAETAPMTRSGSPGRRGIQGEALGLAPNPGSEGQNSRYTIQ